MEHANHVENAYIMTEGINKDKRISKINDNLSKIDSKYKIKNPSLSNRDMLYLEDDDNNVSIAVRGTDVKNNKLDIGSDIALAFGRESHDKNLKKKSKRLKNLIKTAKKDNKNVTIASHSLGGHVVNDVMKSKFRHDVDQVHNFNPALTPWEKMPSRDVKKQLKDKVFQHRISNDPVSAPHFIKKPIGTVLNYHPKPLDNVKKIPSHLKKTFDNLDLLKAHSINQFTIKK